MKKYKFIQIIRDKKGVGTLVPVMGVGVMIAVSFVLAQQYFLARTNNYRRDLEANKLLSVMENLSRNVIHNGFELANKSAYDMFNLDFGTAGCVNGDFSQCCLTIPGAPVPDGTLHLRRGPTGYFGCWPNATQNGLVNFCPDIATVDQPARRFGNAQASGANTDGTWACLGTTSTAGSVCITDPNTPGQEYCALFNQNQTSVAMNDDLMNPSTWDRMVAWGYNLIDQNVGPALNNLDIPTLITPAYAVVATRPLTNSANANQYPPPVSPPALATINVHPRLTTTSGLGIGAPGRHIVQRCLWGEQCSEFWFCVDPTGSGANITPGTNAGNGRCFRQTMHLAPNLQIPANGGLTGNQLCGNADQPRNTAAPDADNSFICVKSSIASGDCATGLGAGEFAYCTKNCREPANVAGNCKNVQDGSTL